MSHGHMNRLGESINVSHGHMNRLAESTNVSHGHTNGLRQVIIDQNDGGICLHDLIGKPRRPAL